MVELTEAETEFLVMCMDIVVDDLMDRNKGNLHEEDEDVLVSTLERVATLKEKLGVTQIDPPSGS